MITESGTNGFGSCTWYRSRRRTPSRLALATARCCTTGGSGKTGRIFVARNTWSRCPLMAWPRIRSLRPRPYASAVSNSVTPSSSARATIARDSRSAYGSPYPHSLDPNCQAPSPILEIFVPVSTSR